MKNPCFLIVTVVGQLPSHVHVTPWTAARQAPLSSTVSQMASLSITNSQGNSYSCPLSWWCHPTILSSITPFFSCVQSFPASGSFPMSQLFASGGQSFEASAASSVLPVNIQGWFPLGLTGLISRKWFCKWFLKKMFPFIFGCAESSLLFSGFL